MPVVCFLATMVSMLFDSTRALALIEHFVEDVHVHVTGKKIARTASGSDFPTLVV